MEEQECMIYGIFTQNEDIYCNVLGVLGMNINIVDGLSHERILVLHT